MTYFIKTGNIYNVAKKEAMNMTEHLPGGNYVVKLNENTGQFYLEHIENFEAPKRIYGDCLKNTQRIIDTFNSRPTTTGVMLTGEKGSGKTLLSKNISIELAQQDVPTIVINAPWCGDKFNTFIQSIDQAAVILFDEFEKIYDRDDQEKILTLLDGVYPTKKLFMLTCNDKWRVDSHMRNRPGRIFYMIDFKGLTPEFITEYCQENLNNKTHIDKMVQVSSLFAEFNFDMLKAMVEEMNRYGEAPDQVLKLLNVKPEFGGDKHYDVKITYLGKEVKNQEWHGNPLSPEGVELGFNPEPDNELCDWEHRVFKPDTLITVDGIKGKFVFEDKGTVVVLTKLQEKTFNWNAF